MSLKIRQLIAAICASKSAGGFISPLRFASSMNIIATGVDTMSGTRLKVKMRYPVIIGSGNLESVRLSFYSFSIGAQDCAALGNAYSIDKVSIEKDGTGLFAPVTFSGVRNKLVPDASTDIQSDAIFPSVFSQTRFTRGEKYWIRYECSVAAAAMKFMYGSKPMGALPAGTGGFYYDPATAIIQDVDAVGAFTNTGTGSGVVSFPWAPVLLGNYVDSDPETWITIGDSIANGSGDVQDADGIYGFMQRAMYDANLVSNPISNMNCAKAGGEAWAWSRNNASLPQAYMKYAKFGLEEYGTNSFPANSSGNQATVRQKSQNIWLAMRAAGISKIVRTALLPRTDSTDSWATEANQSYFGGGTNWSAAGDIKSFNDWCNSRVGADIDYYMPLNSVRGTDSYKWKVNGTANYPTSDGTHPAEAMHTLLADELRSLRSGLI